MMLIVRPGNLDKNACGIVDRRDENKLNPHKGIYSESVFASSRVCDCQESVQLHLVGRIRTRSIGLMRRIRRHTVTEIEETTYVTG